SFTPPGASFLSGDRNLFFASVPGVLSAGETYSGPLFKIAIAATATGSYSGTFVISGGTDIFASGNLASAAFTLNSQINQPPNVISVSPVNGSGVNQTFSTVYSDANGVSDLNAAYLLFNSSLNGTAACWIAYVRSTNTM